MTRRIADQKLPEGLSGAIQRLYEVFERYPHRGMVGGCPCCVTAEDMLRLNSKPLHQLTGEDLEKYAQQAVSTWGDVEDFKRFLPRLLEVLATGSRWDFYPEILIGKLPYAGWQEWPVVEREAVTEFLRAWWRSIIDYPLEDDRRFEDHRCLNTDECLCAIGRAVDDLQLFLDDWAECGSTASLYELVQVIARNAYCPMNERRLSSAFWDNRPDQMNQVIAWLLEPARKEALEKAFFADMAGPHAQDFSQAVELLEGIWSAMRSG